MAARTEPGTRTPHHGPGRRDSHAVIAAHRAQGQEFSAAGVRSFVREEGSGEVVLCVHGIPASSFLYRKLLPVLAAHELRGVAFDLPGLGLAARPVAFEYNWTGLGEWCAAAVDVLALDRFHLVVHDFGGPVGFELCARMPQRIRSLTILNTVVDVEHFPATATSASGAAGAADASVCNYFFEWLDRVRFPLQADPHAAYGYVVPSVSPASDHVGFTVKGPAPYAPWTSWMVYTGKAQPFSLVSKADISPDPGHVNPWTGGSTPISAPNRNFTLLILPEGVDQSTTATSLQTIPQSNVLGSPSNTKAAPMWILANRVYQAFPGYNQGGSGGPTDTPFPTVRAVDYTTGKGVPCAPLNQLPDIVQTPPTSPPATHSPVLRNNLKLKNGLPFDRLLSSDSTAQGVQFAPPNPPGLIQFTRPPLLPGADVSKIPPADNCAGYLGTPMPTHQVALIRMPHVATYFDTKTVTPTTPYVQKQADYVSFTQYGSAIGVYRPGTPFTTSLADAQLKVDSTGGSTILVWPRNLGHAERQKVFAYARQHGFAIMRGGAASEVTTANLLIRLKGASSTYAGAYAPDANRTGVPCYFGTVQKPAHAGKPWSAVTGGKFAASPSNLETAAPQGVRGSTNELLDGRLMKRLVAHIESTGGSYSAR
jgi:pimeloyl-ACP methyl ester carboxylesterase